MDKISLLPILRSRQQAEILTDVLADPGRESSLTDLSRRLDIPYASVHREIERAERAGITKSRKIGNTRLVQADTTSPYFEGLADILVKAFGPPALLSHELGSLDGIEQAYIHGSWAAARTGTTPPRPVGDIDVLVLGEPDRTQLYEALDPLERRLGRPIQISIRPSGWLESGEGAFHAAITRGPLIPLEISAA